MDLLGKAARKKAADVRGTLQEVRSKAQKALTQTDRLTRSMKGLTQEEALEHVRQQERAAQTPDSDMTGLEALRGLTERLKARVA